MLPGLSFEIPLAEDEVGKIYQPSRHYPDPSGDVRIKPDDDGVIGRMGEQDVRWHGEADPVVVGRGGVDQPIVTVRHPCAEVRVLADAAAIHN